MKVEKGGRRKKKEEDSLSFLFFFPWEEDSNSRELRERERRIEGREVFSSVAIQ